MGIVAIDGKGVKRARAVCDGCGREDVVTCDYEAARIGQPLRPIVGQVILKMQGKGWALIKGDLRCPACEAARKARAAATKSAEGVDMVQKVQVAPPREASLEMKRQISELLSDVYDAGRGRYQSGETDKTVAETIGEGCLPGWVAAVREYLYGPDGGNDDMVVMAGDVRAALARVDGALTDLRDARDRIEAKITDLTDLHGTVTALGKRLAGIARAVGPKAGVR